MRNGVKGIALDRIYAVGVGNPRTFGVEFDTIAPDRASLVTSSNAVPCPTQGSITKPVQKRKAGSEVSLPRPPVMGSNPFSGARHSAWIHLISSDWILIKWAGGGFQLLIWISALGCFRRLRVESLNCRRRRRSPQCALSKSSSISLAAVVAVSKASMKSASRPIVWESANIEGMQACWQRRISCFRFPVPEACRQGVNCR